MGNGLEDVVSAGLEAVEEDIVRDARMAELARKAIAMAAGRRRWIEEGDINGAREVTAGPLKGRGAVEECMRLSSVAKSITVGPSRRPVGRSHTRIYGSTNGGN